ncbi:MAG: M20 family metallopeptidase [Beijerinckiaceae bacterium]
MTETTPHRQWLASQHDRMLQMLEALVNTDSGTYDKAGVDRVGDQISAFLREEGIDGEVFAKEKAGDVRRFRVGGPGNRPVVLMGHMDTVFPKGEAARRPFTIKDGRAYGPGVCDMKAGLVINAFALAAYKRFGGNQPPLIGLFTSDEEIGSPASRGDIETTATGALAVLNSEPGRGTGGVVSGRKGGIFMAMELSGKAAHSGANHQDGRSAIGALAAKITALHALTNYDTGITCNVGLINGGQSVNTVAPEARCEIDLRYVKNAQRAPLLAAVEAIAAQEHVPGTSAKVMIKGEFLPLEETPANAALLKTYRAASESLGHAVVTEFTGGCADSGFTSAVGAPTVCATGPVGGKAHSPEEFMVVDTMVPRAQALVETIAALGR